MDKARGKIANLAFYRFVGIAEPMGLRNVLREKCAGLGLRGTILIASEGINAMVAGPWAQAEFFADWLQKDPRFPSLLIKWSESEEIPFRRLLVKVKKEIITFRCAEGNPAIGLAPSMAAEELRLLLQTSNPVLLDVRNDFETKYGTFKGALNPRTKSFSEFPRYVKEEFQQVPKDKTIVTFCTGGIRCEKAAILLRAQGYEKVFQLEGGILEYLARTDGEGFEGRCFVFDERGALDKNLKPLSDRGDDQVAALVKD